MALAIRPSHVFSVASLLCVRSIHSVPCVYRRRLSTVDAGAAPLRARSAQVDFGRCPRTRVDRASRRCFIRGSTPRTPCSSRSERSCRTVTTSTAAARSPPIEPGTSTWSGTRMGRQSKAKRRAACGSRSRTTMALWSVGATGDDRTRKHPAIAVNSQGHVLFGWTEGTACELHVIGSPLLTASDDSSAWPCCDPPLVPTCACSTSDPSRRQAVSTGRTRETRLDAGSTSAVERSARHRS
jgi:hypothetical protein